MSSIVTPPPSDEPSGQNPPDGAIINSSLMLAPLEAAKTDAAAVK